MINSVRNSQQQHSSNLFQALIPNTRMAFLWGGIWLLFLVIGMMSFSSLVNPSIDTDEKYPAKPSTIAPTKLEKTPSQQANFPLWILASLMMGCASGSLLVTYLLKYVSISYPTKQTLASEPTRKTISSNKTKKKSKPIPAKLQPGRKKMPHLAKTKANLGKPQQGAVVPQPQPIPEFLRKPLQQPLPQPIPTPVTLPIPQQPIVTVVSPEESTPLDPRRELTLAELMDLRKRRSLSSLMQDQ